jgi:citrate synthase
MASDATLILDGQEYRFPIREGTEGERAIDIQDLRARTGHITLDPGYGNTGSCESAITFIDGEQGILRYRGIPIEQFEQAPNFVEVAWLLIFGHLPSAEEYRIFSERLTACANLDESMKHHFEGFPRSAPPMAILSAMINALSCFHPDYFELEDRDHFQTGRRRTHQ